MLASIDSLVYFSLYNFIRNNYQVTYNYFSIPRNKKMIK